MNISLTPKLGRFVNRRVASGKYTSASEVVREGLRLLEQRETTHKEFVAKIAKGLDDAKRGKLIDGELFFRELLSEARAGKSRRKAG